MWKNLIPNTNDEETVNNAFCTNGLFRISSETEVTIYPRVQAKIREKRVILCIDSSIILLQDENVMECEYMSFDATIEALAISRSGNILVCASADGRIHGIFIKGIPIFQLYIKEEDVGEDGTFAGIQQMEDSFYIMCKNGSVYRFSNIDEEALETCINISMCENETRVFNDSIVTNVILEKVSTPMLFSTVTSFCLMQADELYKKGRHVSFIMGNERFIYFEEGDRYYQAHLPEDYGGVKALYNIDQMIIGLSNSGMIFEICPYTKIISRPFNECLDYLVEDFIITENNDDDIELLLLTISNDLGNRLMKIVSFPSMQCKSELSMPPCTWLVQQPSTALNIYYLTGENFNEIDLPEEIEMKIMSETQPNERLKKLIYKGRLDEAEEFAKQFNLNLQTICEAKAKRKLQEISLLKENQAGLMNEKFLELLEILKTIESDDFFLSISDSDLPCRNILERFLYEILSRLKDPKYEKNIVDIKERLLRIETLNIIDPYNTNMHWLKFVQHANIGKVCFSLFKTDILSACLIWQRHAASIIPYLDVSGIVTSLNVIPQTTEPFYVIQWLRYFVPSILRIHPAAMSPLVEWCIQKTRSLQYSNHWPEVGLEFSTKILTIFEDITFSYSDFVRQYDFNIQKMKSIVNALQDISVLKKSYNLILTLDNYVKDSLDDTALRILQGVQPSNLKRVTLDFLTPIYLEKGQTPINAIKKYIHYLVSYRKNISLWLERSVIAILLLHNEDEKFQTALLVLKNAPVPWPESVKPLMMFCNSSHPLAVEIQTQFDLQIIKMLKGKYGWPIDSPDNHMQLVFRILKVAVPDMLDDIRNLVKVCPEISSSANFTCCYELARTGQIQKAVQFLHSLEEKQSGECYAKLTNILSAIFADIIDDPNNYNHLIEFVKIITPDAGKDNQQILVNLQNLHLLRTKFQLSISAECLRNKLKRQEVLSAGINFIITNSKNGGANIVHFIWSQVTQLSHLLDFDKVYGILEFCKQMDDLQFSCALAYYVLTVGEISLNNWEFYVDFAALILSQHIDTVANEGISDTVDTLAYPLAYKLLIESLKFGKISQLEILDFLKWVRIGNGAYSLNIVPEYYGDITSVNKKISDHLSARNVEAKQNGTHLTNRLESIFIFDEVAEIQETVKPTNDPTPIINCVSMALACLDEYLPFPINRFINPEIKNNIGDIKTTFITQLEMLVKSKQFSSWYDIVQYMSKYEISSSILPAERLIVNKKKMYKYLLSQKEPNFIELFAILLADPNPEAPLKCLENELKTGQPKLHFLILAEMYHTYIEDMEQVASDREKRMKYFYYTELTKQDSDLKCKTNISFISISMLMKEMKNKVLDVEFLKRMSYDFDWDLQEVLVSQIVSVLHMQEPSYEMKIDAFGKEQIAMKVSANEIRNLCEPYIQEITNTGLLASKLVNLISEINFYFYELYLCVLDILTYINAMPRHMEMWANILLFLKHKMVTKRRQRPGQIEMDWWLKSQLEVGVLPKIAKYRFPFKPIVQDTFKDILDIEVNVDNCESWFPLIKLHTVNQGMTTQSDIIQEQEYYCMSAVKNSITENKQQSEDSDTWHLQPVNNAFLQSIVRLIRHMSTPSKILFILYFVTNHAPEGADQVEAASECYKFAVKHEQQLVTHKRAEETLIKIKRKYPIIKTQHLLHVYGMVDENLLQLGENPRGLIYSLYHHDSILSSPKADINSLVLEISQLYHLNFGEIQVSLLKNWLCCTNSGDSKEEDETFCEGLNVSASGIEIVNEEYIIRAHYILSSWKSPDALEFLIAQMFSVDGSVNTAAQLQIFECFSKLIDATSITYTEALSQQQYIVLRCVHYLKQLGYKYTLDQFIKSDKGSILRKIWQKHANNQLALEAISYICIGHDILIPTIWNGVLKQMVNLNMVSKLNELVDVLSCEQALLYTEGLASAWDCVLRAPFKNANRSRSFEQESILSKNLFRIQACPLIKQLNLVAFAEDCVRLDRPHMAAVFVALANEKQKKLIVPLITQQKKETLKKEITDLEEIGISPIIINFAIQTLKL